MERDGARLAVTVYPEPDPTAPVAMIWPAMGVPARYYRPFATALHDAGLAVVVVDLRGTGTSEPRAGRATRFGLAELVTDVAAVCDAMKSRLDGRRLLLVGHSLGGQVAALHLASAADSPADGLALVACGAPYHRCYPPARGAGVLSFAQAVAATSAVLGYWPGHRLGFGGRQSRGVMSDWAHLVRTGRFPPLTGVGEVADTVAGLAAVQRPVFAATVAGDRLTPAATTEHLLGMLPSATITRHHYTPAESGAPMDHFRWVRASRPLAGRLATFAATLNP